MFYPPGRSLGVGAWVVGLVLFLALPAWARQVKITRNDGSVLQGEIVSEDDKSITIKISGIDTPIQRSDIKEMQYLLTIDEQYRQKRAQIADDDVDGRYNLALWLYENKALALAKQEIASLAAKFPNDSRVTNLGKMVDARIKIGAEAPGENPGNPPAAPVQPVPPPAAVPNPANILPKTRLSPAQINLIRLYEVQIPPEKPIVDIDNKVMLEAFRVYAADERIPRDANMQQRFLGRPGWEKLKLLFDLNATDLWMKAIIKNDVDAIIPFRAKIHTGYVLNYCGSVQCHGGQNAGDFFLFRNDPASDATIYTNYYILTRYGVGGKGKGYMIDRSLPRQSYIIQYALPQATAIYPHPDVPGWQPLFIDERDPRFQSVVDWITSLPSHPPPNYTLDYKIPTLPSKLAPPKPAATPPPAAPAPPAAPPR